MKMMKNGLFVVAWVVFSIGVYTPALALDVDVSTESSVNVTRTSDKSDDGVYTKSTTTTEVRTTSETKNEKESDRATSSKEKDYWGNDVDSTTTVRAQVGEDHRSNVSAFVHNLLNIANRSGGIGAEVRAIAHEEDDSSTTTIESINKVEARGKFKTFLIGSDYKNLGMIRSELAKTDNRIERLQAAASSTTSVSVKADIAAQIKLLQDDKLKVTAFVEAHENTFSLLGWFVKIFVK